MARTLSTQHGACLRNLAFLLGGLICLSLICRADCTYRDYHAYEMDSAPLPTGTLVFTTGSLNAVYRMDLPSRKFETISLTGARAEEFDRISFISGPYNGVFAIQMEFGESFVFRHVTGEKHCAVLKELGLASFPTVSPDGTRVAYYKGSQDGLSGDLCVRDLRSPSEDVVARSASVRSNPTWAADGKRLACALEVDKVEAAHFPHRHYSEDYINRSKTLTCAGVLDLRTRSFIPWGIDTEAMWEPGEQTMLSAGSGGDDPARLQFSKGESKEISLPARLSDIYGFTKEGKIVFSTEARKEDEVAPIVGHQNGDGIIRTALMAIRIGSMDGRKATPLVCVYGEWADWDAGSGFAASWSNEKW